MAKILIVDDAAFLRHKVSKLLKAHGHDVIEAEDGKQAVEKYSGEKPDVVLMDITMPEMDGITAVKELVKIDPSVKISMLSAVGQQEMIIDAIRAGAREFILKPFQPEKVVAVVNKLLSL